MNASLIEELNKMITNNGPMFGPSLAHLLLFNPIDQSILTPESRGLLHSRIELTKQEYINYIIPKTGQIVQGLTRDSRTKYPDCSNGISKCFKRSNDNKLREQLLESYRASLAFPLDQITLNGLNKTILNPQTEENVKYYFKRGHRYIFSYRFKFPQEIKNKIQIKYNEINNPDKESFLEFAINVGSSTKKFWNAYEDFAVHYPKPWLELMTDDIFGIRIIDTNYEQSHANINRILNNRQNLKLKGFTHITDRFTNHTTRLKDGKPGGVHLVVMDNALGNHPIEVQYLCLESGIMHTTGKWADKLYKHRDKKASKNY